MREHFHTFTLHILSAPDGYLLTARCDGVGECAPLLLDREAFAPLAVRATDPGLWYAMPETARALGIRLYQIVFRDDVRDLFLQAVAISQTNNNPLRIVVTLPGAPELHELPWELLHNGRRFFATNRATTIVRYVEQMAPVRSLVVEPPIRVLLSTATPSGCPPINVTAEEHIVRIALDELGDQAELVVQHDLSFDQLRHLLMRQERRGRPFHIWHHIGHGSIFSDQGVGTFSLILDDGGNAYNVSLTRIASVIHSCPSLRGAVLNTCHSADTSGLAPALAALGVPLVVGFRGAIDQEISQIFAEVFYTALADVPADAAVAEARLVLATDLLGTAAWATPLLFLRTTDASFLSHPSQLQSIPEPTTSASTSRFKTGKIVAKHATRIGDISFGHMPIRQGSPNHVEFDTDTLETETLTEIASLSITDDENLRRFAELQSLARTISGEEQM